MPDDGQVDPSQTIETLRRQLDALRAERDEALAQQAATAEVLQIINHSGGDPAPVLDAILEKAMSLCESAYGHIYTYDGERIHAAAIRGEPRFVSWLQQRGSYPPGRGTPVERTLQGEDIVHIADATQEELYRTSSVFKELIELSGIRTGVTVALRRDSTFLGTINVYRREVRPFLDKQIALLQNFAEQAVIAMENARLLTETREALEQQTATAEVLQVINSSPGDLTPVFDGMLERAMRLCEAAFGTFGLRRDGEQFHIVAQRGVPAKLAEYLQKPYRAEPGTAMGRFSSGEQLLNITDLNADPASLVNGPRRRAYAELGGARSILAVPLRKDETLLGALTVYRQEARPFSGKQIALLQNFAAQAVIAMENARLITETREALEQQTATAEVLQVINSSPDDLAPVFDAILDKALHLCEANFGTFWKRDGDRFYPGALRGVPPAFARYMRREPLLPAPNSGLGRAAGGEPCVHSRYCR